MKRWGKEGPLPWLGALLLAVGAATCSLPASGATTIVLGPNDSGVGSGCSALGGAWNGAGTCQLSGQVDVQSGDSVVVDSGAEVVIAATGALTVYGTVELEGGAVSTTGSLTIMDVGTLFDNGTVVVEPGAVVSNSGIWTAYAVTGSILNEGSLVNEAGASFSVQRGGSSQGYSGVYFTNEGTLENTGNFLSYGNLTNLGNGSIVNSGPIGLLSSTRNFGHYTAAVTVNSGSFENMASGTLTLSGSTFNNTGSFVNAGTFTESPNVYTVVNNLGNFTTSGNLTNYAFIANAGSGTFANSGEITNVDGCSIQSCGTISNEGVMVNLARGYIDNQGNLGNSNPNLRRPALGAFTNLGILENLNVLDNAAGGTMVNNGTLETSGTFSNADLVTNFGSIDNLGVIVNQGTISNNSTGTISNGRTITNAGAILNAGSIVNNCGGTLEGGGSVSGNPLNTTAVCVTTTFAAPEFTPGALAPLLFIVFLAVAYMLRRREPTARMEAESIFSVHTKSKTFDSGYAAFGWNPDVGRRAS